MSITGELSAAGGGALGALVALVYLLFFWKLDWVRDLTVRDVNSIKYKVKKNRVIGNLPPVYPNGWFGVIESSQLKKGQVEHVTALGQNLAVFRTESGVARIVNAYCPHLGANLAEGGSVVGEDIECPFHNWRFCGESGKCTSIPYSTKIPSGVKTKVWETFETNGVVFMWHHAESEPPSWWPEPIEEISNRTWHYQGRNEFYINCHIQEIPENGADWAHLNTLHGPSIVAESFLDKIVRHTWDDAYWSDNLSASEDPDQEQRGPKHIATSHLKHRLTFFNKYSTVKLNVVASQIGPGYVQLRMDSAFGTMCIVQTVTPLQPLLQKVCHLMFAPTLAAPYSRLTMIGETLQFTRDVNVWNHKKYLENPMLVSEEKPIKAFRRWYKQFYSESSPTYQSCKNNTLDW